MIIYINITIIIDVLHIYCRDFLPNNGIHFLNCRLFRLAYFILHQVKELSEKYHLSPNSHVYANLVGRLRDADHNSRVTLDVELHLFIPTVGAVAFRPVFGVDGKDTPMIPRFGVLVVHVLPVLCVETCKIYQWPWISGGRWVVLES